MRYILKPKNNIEQKLGRKFKDTMKSMSGPKMD